MATAQIRRTSTSEAIVQHLLDRIRAGEFGPGDRLPSEKDLQAELGVGRLSLREGLARLTALGVIRVDHGRGAFVQESVNTATIGQALTPLFAERSAIGLQDLIHARALIDGEVAALAAARRTEADIDQLVAMLQQPLDPADQHVALAALDFEFHRTVARIAANRFLAVMLDALANHVRSFLLHYVRSCRDPKSVIERHRPIVEAIIDGDAERARAAAREHVEICKSSFEAYVNQRKKRSVKRTSPSR